MKRLLMKVTSRERPAKLLDTVRLYLSLASNPADMVWLFSFDRDDSSCLSEEFLKSLRALFTTRPIIVHGVSGSKIAAINRDVSDIHPGRWDILLNISDDQRPIVQGYDMRIRDLMPSNLDASLWFNSEHPSINTQEIVGQAYYRRFGYVYHPDFKSLYADNLSTSLSVLLCKSIRGNLQLVKHCHPCWGGGFPLDALYKRNEAFSEIDRKTYERLLATCVKSLS